MGTHMATITTDMSEPMSQIETQLDNNSTKTAVSVSVSVEAEATTSSEVAKVSEDPADPADVSADFKLQAEALFATMKAEAALEHDDLDEELMKTPEEEDIEDIAKKHYKQQIEQLKQEQVMQDEAKDEEIADLRKMLAEQKLRDEAKASAPPQPKDAKQIDPIRQEVSMNGVRSKLLICTFQSGKGKIGIQFKRYGSQFFIVDTIANTQISKYRGIGPGLLLYQVVSSAPGSSTGGNISVSHSEELAQRILQEFGKGKQIQMKFLILPDSIPVQNIHQHVLKQQVPLIQYYPGQAFNRPVINAPYIRF